MSETTVAGWPPPAPVAPWCRLVGRVIGPDADPHTVHAQVVVDPDAERPTVVLPDGRALVASRVVCTTDDEGWLVHTGADGVVRRWVDVVAPGEGVTPAGVWTTTVRVTVPGVSGDRWVRHVSLAQGTVVDLTDLAPQASYVGDALTVAEQSAQAAAASAEASAVSASQAATDLASARGEAAASASSAQAAALSATSAEASASQAAADLATVRGEVQSGIHDGTGVVSIVDDDGDGTATVTLTDGTTSALPLPAGPKGADATQPSFTVGTVTTVPAGGAATATVTGSAPNWKLNFGLVTGQPDDYRIVGAGRPDVSGTMTTDIAARVAAAPPGSTFNSTDGAGTGAWAWQKTTAGWVVTMGDTGWRGVSPEAGYTVTIRRINQNIAFSFNVNQPTVAMPDWRFPAGFSPSGFFDLERAMYRGGTTNITGYFRIIWGILKYNGSLSAVNATALEMLPTTDAWPLTRPGTPYNQ